MKNIFTPFIVLVCAGFSSAQNNIADARTFGVGQTVTVRGVATNGSEFGSYRYIQDGSAGIVVFGNSLSGVQRYDSITVTGTLTDFSGLLEIAPVSNVVNHGPAVTQPSPISISILTASENLESQLIKLSNVTFIQTGSFTGNTTYQVTDGVNNFEVRILSGTNLVGTTIPLDPVTLYGPEGQYNLNYQIWPRDTNDILNYASTLDFQTKSDNEESLITVYPNPVCDQVQIVSKSNLKDSDFLILDASGRVILKDKFYDKSKTINIANFNSGVYFLIIQDELTPIRFIKE